MTAFRAIPLSVHAGLETLAGPAVMAAPFVLGFGLAATKLGQTLIENQDTLTNIAGVVLIAMGILFMGSLLVPRLNREWRVDALMARAGKGGPIVAGAAFSVAWTPCVGTGMRRAMSLT